MSVYFICLVGLCVGYLLFITIQRFADLLSSATPWARLFDVFLFSRFLRAFWKAKGMATDGWNMTSSIAFQFGRFILPPRRPIEGLLSSNNPSGSLLWFLISARSWVVVIKSSHSSYGFFLLSLGCGWNNVTHPIIQRHSSVCRLFICLIDYRGFSFIHNPAFVIKLFLMFIKVVVPLDWRGPLVTSSVRLVSLGFSFFPWSMSHLGLSLLCHWGQVVKIS